MHEGERLGKNFWKKPISLWSGQGPAGQLALNFMWCHCGDLYATVDSSLIFWSVLTVEDYVKEKPDFQINYGANPQINRQV